MAIIKKTNYIKGLGDLFVKVNTQDNPSLTIDEGESLSLYSGVATGVVSLSQAKVLNGAYSIKVDVPAIADGLKYTPASAIDWSANEDTLYLGNLYFTGAGAVSIKFSEGANFETYQVTIASGDINKWKRVLVDLSNPTSSTGTVNWAAIDDIEITYSVASDFYLDGMYFFDSYKDTAREGNVRIGCLDDFTLDTESESIDLKCSKGNITDTTIISKTQTITSVIKDFNPNAFALLGGGEVTTDDIVKMVEAEKTTVPSAGPYTYTLIEGTSLRSGDGYGVFVYNTSTSEMFQQTDDPNIIESGFYHVNTTTGVITFNSAQAGIDVSINYNVQVSSGSTYEDKTDPTFLEFSLQFKVQTTQNKEVLWFFPSLKSNKLAPSPTRDEFWTAEFEAKVLEDPISGNNSMLHIVE